MLIAALALGAPDAASAQQQVTPPDAPLPGETLPGERPTAASAAPAATTFDEPLRLILSADVAGGVNPRAFSTDFGGVLRYTYGRDPTNPLWDDLYVQGGLTVAPNPAWVQTSVHAELSPIAVLQLRVQGDVYRFFGDFDALLSFPSADAEFGDDARDDLDGAEEAGWGYRALFQPTLRYKLGPVLLRNQTDLAWYVLPGEGPYLLELQYDTLLREDGDGLVANRTQALFEVWRGDGEGEVLYVGPQYEYVRSFDAGLTRQRLGGLLLWIPSDVLGPFARPRIYLAAGVNLQDPNRDDEAWVVGGVGLDWDVF